MEQTLDNPYPDAWEYEGDARNTAGIPGMGPGGGPIDDEPDFDVASGGQQPHGVWGVWLRLTGPRGSQSLDATGRERLRRSRLLSVLLAVTLLIVVVILPKGFIPVLDFGTFGAVTIAMLTLIICIPLNRAGQVNAAGAVFCVGVTVALAWSLLDTPNGLGMQDLPTYDLFALPIVIAGILLPRRAPFFFWVGCAFFIIGDITYERHQLNLTAYIDQVGIYATVIIPLMLTFVIAVVSWLGAGSVQRAMIEADRTADLERAYRQIDAQKRRLESAVNIIQNVHARVANGDFSARAPASVGELMGVGVSLNLMLDRLSRLRGAEGALNAIDQGGRILAQYAWELGAGRLQAAAPHTGSPMLDVVGAALDQMRRALYVQVTGLATSLQAVTKHSDDLMTSTRALGWHTTESGRRIGALNDAVQAMRATAERAEAALAPAADWLEQAATQGWADGAPLAQTVTEGLSGVRQVIAMADQSPSGQLALERARASEREVFERVGATERELAEALAQARGLLSRLADQSGSLGPPRQLP